MRASTTLKIFSIVTHFFIVIGFGHGILTLGVLEIITFPYFHANFSLVPTPSETNFGMTGLTTLLGQCILIFSIFIKNEKKGFYANLAGLALLWLSIFYFWFSVYTGNNTFFATITTLPFLICTLIPFFKDPIKNTWRKFVDE